MPIRVLVVDPRVFGCSVISFIQGWHIEVDTSDGAVIQILDADHLAHNVDVIAEKALSVTRQVVFSA